MKAVVAAFNQEKALVGAFSVIVQLHRWIDLRHYSCRVEAEVEVEEVQLRGEPAHNTTAAEAQHARCSPQLHPPRGRQGPLKTRNSESDCFDLYMKNKYIFFRYQQDHNSHLQR